MKPSIASDAVKLSASKMITMMISMISAMLLSRFRTLEEYGTYSQLLLVVNLITTVFMLGLPNSINFFLAKAKDNNEKQKFLSIYYTISTILSLVTGLILILITPFIIDYFDNPVIKSFMYVLAILPWANIILSSIENVLIVYRKTTILVVFRVLNSVSLLTIILIVELLNLGFVTYMILFISVEAVFAISVYLIVKNISGHIKISFDKLLIKRIFSFSIPIGLASVIGVLSVQLGNLVIGKFFSTVDLAVYTNASREMPVTIFASSLTAVLMPQLVRLLNTKRYNEAINLWGNTISISYTIICFFSIALFVFAPEVISLLYSDKYLSGVTVFRVYSLVLLLRFTYFGIILNSIGKTKFILYSSLAALLLNMGFSYLFYVIFGFIGPAIATFVSMFLVALFQIIATSRSINISFNKIFPWRELMDITFINIMFGLLFAYVKKEIPLETFAGEITESIFIGIIWSGLYLILMLKKIKQKWRSLNGSI